jgi:hypothetical protein
MNSCVGERGQHATEPDASPWGFTGGYGRIEVAS